MQRPRARAPRALSVAIAVIGALAGGFAAGASADARDPVPDVRELHEEMNRAHGGMGMGDHAGGMDEMHAEVSARLSDEDRALHDGMHEACAFSHARSNG